MLSIIAVGFCLVVSLNIRSVKSSATVQSSVVLIGERVELKCNKTIPASWKYTSWNSSTETNIYLGRDDIITTMRSRYKIDKRISGQHNLIIDYVDLAHAGRYRCTGVSVQQQYLLNDIHVDLHVQLTVLGSHPACSGNTSEADVTTKEQRRIHLSIRCSISYTGNAFPVFSWTKNNVENIAANTNTSGTDQVPLTSTSLITQQTRANDSGATFYCRMTFPTPNTSTYNVIDNFAYTWNYTLYGPRDLSIVEYEDHLECLADGNPVPIYRWTNVGANISISINGPVYTLILTNDKEHTLFCTSENIFAFVSKNYTIKGRAKDFDVTSDISYSPIWLTTIAIAGSHLVLLAIIIILSYVIYRKRLKGGSSDRPDVALNKDLSSYDDNALSSQRSPNYIVEGKRSAGSKTSGRHGDSKSRAATIQMAPSTLKNPRIAATDAEYCSVTDRSSTSQKPQIYCELRFTDQPRADYINPPLAE